MRFLVWLDYYYSSDENDLLLKYFEVCYDCSYQSDDWDEAWEYILEGSELEEMDIDQVFELYAGSDMGDRYDRVG